MAIAKNITPSTTETAECNLHLQVPISIFTVRSECHKRKIYGSELRFLKKQTERVAIPKPLVTDVISKCHLKLVL